MSARKIVALLSALSLATACTAIIGLEDLPPAPVYDAGPVATQTPDTSTTPPDAGPPVGDVNAAITQYATAFCTKYQTCNRAIFEFDYRNIEECIAAQGGTIQGAAGRPGIAATSKTFEDCAANTTALACDAFISSDSDFACNVRGTRKVAERCTNGAQCETGFCGSDAKTCRGCVNPPDTGAACAADKRCGAGLVCNTKNVCVTQSLVDQSCNDAEKPCRFGLACLNAVCKTVPAVAGADCTAATGNCDITQGLVCLTGKCVTIVSVAAGGVCGFGGGSAKLCRRGAACPGTDGGTCPAPPVENEPCEVDGVSPGCLLPLRCVDKKCVQPQPSSFCE